ncbi:hypothetical protein HYFRA_00009398 [Hymenoscyphus fraxineus]|uniref:Uncharacterized protein n=1 Tax=Hymenoscyphus fraxineus TaxID=746836 RepID=A0A9N9L434_9HELO|nr:hypothetical protein HYFRA_00009398 [Hymenoscyphus fraxineus]
MEGSWKLLWTSQPSSIRSTDIRTLVARHQKQSIAPSSGGTSYILVLAPNLLMPDIGANQSVAANLMKWCSWRCFQQAFISVALTPPDVLRRPREPLKRPWNLDAPNTPPHHRWATIYHQQRHRLLSPEARLPAGTRVPICGGSRASHTQCLLTPALPSISTNQDDGQTLLLASSPPRFLPPRLLASVSTSELEAHELSRGTVFWHGLHGAQGVQRNHGDFGGVSGSQHSDRVR